MRTFALPVHQELAGSSRLPALAYPQSQLQTAQIAWLLLMGGVAACSATFLDYGLKIPGHAIIRGVFPMAFGLAVVPRRMAGTVMGAGALMSAMLIRGAGVGAIGAGAMTSLVLTGPLLDVALWRAGPGWKLYFHFALWGLISNWSALVVRAGFKLIGIEHIGKRPFAEWLPWALVTYTVCGLLAGLLSAWVCFRFTERQKTDSRESDE